MEWENEGILLSVRPHGESGAVAHILCEDYGLQAGYLYRSQKSGAMLQQGYHLHCRWHSKSQEQLGSFTLEPIRNLPALHMGHKQALAALRAACDLCRACLPEREPCPAIYSGLVSYLENLSPDLWAETLCMFEIGLLREMGFGLNLQSCVQCGRMDDLTHISPRSGHAVCAEHAAPYRDKLLPIPAFFNSGGEGSAEEGLKLTAYFLEHRLFAQTTFPMPESRQSLLI